MKEFYVTLMMKINQNRFQLQLDRSAITLSVICAVQCMLLPITAIMLPTVSLLPFSEEVFHSALLFFVIPISAFAMLMGCKKHKSYDVIGYGLVGLMLLIVSAVWGHDLLGETGEIVSTFFGSSILAFGHIQNQKKCKDSCH